MEHVEVLQDIRDDFIKMGGDAADVAALNAAIAALSAPQSDDWVLVPREPTPEMLSAAGRLQACECGFVGDMSPMDGEEYAAMLAAAPQPPADAHCTTCSCVPGMTPAVRLDTTPAEKEGAVRDHLIRIGWAPPPEAQAQPVAWFPTYGNGKLVRNYGDGSPVPASKTKEEAEQAKRCHLGATGPVIPLYAHPPPSAPVGVEVASLPALWRQREDNGEERTEFDKGYEQASDECAEALERAIAQQPVADEKPIGWWNGILPDVTDRSPYDPSIRWGADAENSGHDIPLYAGVNPSRAQQPAAVDDDTLESLIEESDGHWSEDEFRIEGPDLMRLLRDAALAGQQGGG